MIRSLLVSPLQLTMAFTILALAASQAQAQTQTKPFFIAGSGTAPQGVSLFGDDSPHDSAGLMVPFGPYTGDQGNFNSLSFDSATLSGTFEGSFVFVDLFGDELFCTYGDTDPKLDNPAKEEGTYQIVPVGGGNIIVVFLAEFNPVPSKSTGRFRRVADGSLIMLAVTEPFPFLLDEDGFSPPFDYSWIGKGWIRFR